VSVDEARDLILAEGLGETGMVVALRMGEDPGPERMAGLLDAVALVSADAGVAQTVSRRLAYALFSLAHHGAGQVESWAAAGRSWREELLEQEIPALLLAVEWFFSGDRPTPDQG
jgi:hypothetical protein